MEELMYNATTIANLIIKNDMKLKCSQKFISNIWEHEKEFLPIKYRFNKKKFMLDVMHEINYFQNRAAISIEIVDIEKYLNAKGSKYQLIKFHEYSELASYFMILRLRMLFIDKQDFVRMKLRTLLKDYGYKHKAENLMSYLKYCMCFYHIQTFKKGKDLCDIEDFKLDDMITFRLVVNYRESLPFLNQEL